jgi:hypothetical protein
MNTQAAIDDIRLMQEYKERMDKEENDRANKLRYILYKSRICIPRPVLLLHSAYALLYYVRCLYAKTLYHSTVTIYYATTTSTMISITTDDADSTIGVWS